MEEIERVGRPGEVVAPTGDGSEEAVGMEEGREEDRSSFIARDAEEFARKYPHVRAEMLEQDEMFRRFCGSRYGAEPLAELFEDYLAVVEGVRAAALAKAESKTGRGTGSGGSGGGEALTARQQRELDEWNRAYPQMKMTAKEFLARE